MYEFYFTFHTMTSAQQAAQVLNSRGIAAQFQRAPKKISPMGCGYAVRVSGLEGYSSAAALRKTGTLYQRVFRVMDENVEEVAL